MNILDTIYQLRYPTLKGKLANWNNMQAFVDIMQGAMTNPMQLNYLKQLNAKVQKKNPNYKGKISLIVKVINDETGIEFGSIKEVGNKIGKSQASVRLRIKNGNAVGLVNPVTKHFICVKVPELASYLQQGYRPAHFTVVKKDKK